MRYAMRITEDTAEFIGKYFNDGVVPQVEEGVKLFAIGDDDTPNEILNLDDFDTAFKDFEIVKHSTLFKVDI